MSTTGIVLGAVGGYLTASPFIAATFGKAMRWADRATPPPDDDVQRIGYVIPVPPPRREDDWLAAAPVEVWLTPELTDRLFDELIAIEGLQ